LYSYAIQDIAAAKVTSMRLVEKYYWKSEDPIDMIMGAGAIAMDMIMKDNYAYLEAVFTVRDAADSKELWSKKLKIDLTRRGMSMEESLPLINDKTARFFIRECFSKGGSKKR
jgi:hypothetical protein